MGLSMKTFNIIRIHWKIWFLGRGSWKTNILGKFPKRGLGPFADLRGAWKKKRGWCFWGGDWCPNAHYVEELDIRYKEIKIKQHKHVTNLRCVLDETMSGETMALRVIKKIRSRLKIFDPKNRFLEVPLS